MKEKCLVIILIVSLLFIPIVHAGNDMITIHPPGNHTIEEVFFINGTTTLPAGKTLVIDIEPVRLHPAPSHDPPKNTTALTGQVITEKSTGGISLWSYVVGSASLIPDDYTIHVTSFGPTTIESSSDFTIQSQNGTQHGIDRPADERDQPHLLSSHQPAAQSPELLRVVGVNPLPQDGPGGNTSYSLSIADSGQLVTLHNRNGPDLFAYNGNGSLIWNRTLSAGQPPWITSISIGPDAQDLIVTQLVPACCHGSVTNTSSNKVILFDRAGSELWEYPTMNPPLASGISPDGQEFFIGTEDGRILSFNHEGTLRWTTTAGAPVTSFAISRDGNTIVATGDSNYYYHNLYDEPLNPADMFVLDRNGTLLWNYQTGGLNTVAVSDNGSVIAVLEERSGTIQVFNQSGSRIATRSLGGASSAFALSHDGNLVLAETQGGTVYGLDRTGTTLWTITTGPGSPGLAFSSDDTSIILGNGRLVARYDRRGKLLGEYPADGQLQALKQAVRDARVFVAMTDRSLVFLSLDKPVIATEMPVNTPVTMIPEKVTVPQTSMKAPVNPGIAILALAGIALGKIISPKKGKSG